MRTQHDPANQSFTDAAHEIAKTTIHPHLFVNRGISLERTKLEHGGEHRIFDGEMAIDVIMRVEVPNYKDPLVFTVQERFRRIAYAKYQDITITEWNTASNMPSELYKIRANYVLYGYFDQRDASFHSWYLLNTTLMLEDIANGMLPVESRFNNKGQRFITIPIDALMKRKVINMYMPAPA